MAAEVLFAAAKDKDMPRFLQRVNKAQAPTAALLMTTVLIQIMLFVTLASNNAFDFMLNMTSAVSLIPFVLAAGYALKLVVTRDSYGTQPSGWTRDLVVAALATVYTVFLLFAAGPKYMLVSFLIYAPGSVLFVMARRQQGRKAFSPRELAICVVSVIGAVAGAVGLISGWITI
jgi:arginine:ornithine antiporter/lysine permease